MPVQQRKTLCVHVNGVKIGGGFPVVIQSMTDTPTADVQATVAQITDLVRAGSELVRITVNDDAAAQAVPGICRILHERGITVPLIGDFHFNGHLLLTRYPETAQVLAKYRINPGNLGRGKTHDEHFEIMIAEAVRHQKPVRIGVNGGSLDLDLLEEMMGCRAGEDGRKTEREVFCDAMVESALRSARRALELGMREDQIVLSAKTSDLQDLVAVYQALAARCSFALHLGMTEAGSQQEGVIASTAAVSILLQQGIGDTVRISLTPDRHTPRTQEVVVARQILQALGMRYFQPRVISCPGCGRTSARFFQDLLDAVKRYIAKRTPEWEKNHPEVSHMTVAVMGCVVNGPGESRHADIGISLPGSAEEPAAPVFIKGEHAMTLKGQDLAGQFLEVLEKFVQSSY